MYPHRWRMLILVYELIIILVRRVIYTIELVHTALLCTRTVRDLRACACVSTPARVRVRVACMRLCQLRLCLGPLRLCLRLSLHLCACDPRKTCRASRPSLRLRGNAPSSRVPGQGTRSAGGRRSHHAAVGWLRGPRRRWRPGPLGAQIGPCAMGFFGSMRRRTSRLAAVAADTTHAR